MKKQRQISCHAEISIPELTVKILKYDRQDHFSAIKIPVYNIGSGIAKNITFNANIIVNNAIFECLKGIEKITFLNDKEADRSICFSSDEVRYGHCFSLSNDNCSIYKKIPYIFPKESILIDLPSSFKSILELYCDLAAINMRVDISEYLSLEIEVDYLDIGNAEKTNKFRIRLNETHEKSINNGETSIEFKFLISNIL